MEAAIAIDYEFWKFWMAAGNFIGILISLYLFLTRLSRVNKDEIKNIADDIDEISDRLLVVETDMKAMPNHQDLSNLYQRINAMSDDVSEMSGSMKALTVQLSLINEHLLSQGKR
jgi:predicted  nucleic acid-binding Zn-ribbon protein